MKIREIPKQAQVNALEKHSVGSISYSIMLHKHTCLKTCKSAFASKDMNHSIAASCYKKLYTIHYTTLFLCAHDFYINYTCSSKTTEFKWEDNYASCININMKSMEQAQKKALMKSMVVVASCWVDAFFYQHGLQWEQEGGLPSIRLMTQRIPQYLHWNNFSKSFNENGSSFSFQLRLLQVL